MQMEFTGRQVTITKKLRAQAEAGLERIQRTLGKSASAHVVLTVEKHRQIAEVTVTTKNLDIVGLAESTVMETALHDALSKAEKQVLKHGNRLRAQKRKPKEEKHTAVPVVARGRRIAAHPADVEEGHEVAPTGRKNATATKQNGNGRSGKNGNGQATVPVLVHSFPAKALVQEPHIVRSRDSVALRPMTLEEAVKEAEFRDREVFVFRDNAGNVKVLHRKKDGKMELIEAP